MSNDHTDALNQVPRSDSSSQSNEHAAEHPEFVADPVH